MAKSRLFIGSSSEALPVAFALQENLERDTEPTVWTQGIFELSKSTLDSLVRALTVTDFAVFIFNPDDVLKLRGHNVTVARDNVIFELGLFMGALGIDKVFFVVPHGQDDLHLPSDLLGITPATYDPARSDNNLSAALGPAANRIRARIKSSSGSTRSDLPATFPSSSLNETDQIALLASWLDSEIVAVIVRPTRHTEIERQLSLPAGASSRFLPRAIAIAGRKFDIVVNTPELLQLRVRS